MPRRFCIETTDGVVCGAVFTGDTERCPPHQAAADKRLQQRRGTTAQRGYGGEHQRIKAEMISRWNPGDPCAHCGQPTLDKTRLDLAHTADRAGYRGLAHDVCNRGNR